MDSSQYSSLHNMRSIRSRGAASSDTEADVVAADEALLAAMAGSPREKPFAAYTRCYRAALLFIQTNAALSLALVFLLLLFFFLSLSPSLSSSSLQASKFHCCLTGPGLVPLSAAAGGNRVERRALAAGERMKPFIFVYDFGSKYTADVRKMTPNWYSEVYDAERVFYEYVLENSSVRTWNPEAASLFYVPFFSAYYTSCHYRDWDVNMKDAVKKTSEMWEQIIRRVRSEFPYFNRTNGRDHFSLLSMDFGRCQAIPFVDPGVMGGMFFLQSSGDQLLRTTHTHPTRSMQIIAYNYGKALATDVPDIPCYKPGIDIVIPPTLELSSKGLMPVTAPLATTRSITALFRFRATHHHSQPVLHFNHDIRRDLFQLFEKKGVEGWEFGAREPEKVMREDMTHSVFCICPPGHSQWTARLVKSILAGCIPVTFFREHDNPWQNEIDYSRFSVNVDPDEIHTLVERLDSILRNPRQLLRMQRDIKAVQSQFSWDASLEEGVQSHICRALWCRARSIEEGPVGHMRREAKLREKP